MASGNKCELDDRIVELNLNITKSQQSEAADLWSRFSQWVHCICVVTFDLELGQAMEVIYPSHVKLSEQEKSNVCYLAFPDSNSNCMGDTQFHVRLRVSSVRSSVGLSPNYVAYNMSCLPTLQADIGHYWGFVYFRQVKDATLPRGYFQKSLVLLTRLPFVNLFTEMCALIAPEYFDNGEVSLEAACIHINQWPPLSAGETISLPLLGNVFQTYIPNQSSHKLVPQPSPDLHVGFSLNGPTLPHVLSSVHEVNIFQSLYSVLSHVHLLWELVLTTEPIVVMASSPTICSHMVQALVSMISPLCYCADSRPYFTIHDSEFKEFTTSRHGPPPVILGVTNPFFSKTLQHWPHTIKLCEGQTSVQKQKLKRNGKQDSLPGVYTQYKPFLQKDKIITKKLMSGIRSKRPTEVQTAILRRHLLELTQSFMIPLERYIASLMPLKKNISPFKGTPIPEPFNPEDFLSTLSHSGPQLTSPVKGDWVGLYKTFFRSSNFSSWFNVRYMDLTHKLQTLQLEAIAEADVGRWVNGKQEVEIVDMILNIRQKLSLVKERGLPLKLVTIEQLKRQIEEMTYSLPDDLKAILA